MSKEYDPTPSRLIWLEEENEKLRHLAGLAVQMRAAQQAYFKSRTRDLLLAAKVAEADFDKMAKAMMEARR